MIYSSSSVESIMSYALKLKDKQLREFINSKLIYKGKGSFGQLLEKYYFGYTPNSDSSPDFVEVGLELKSSPLKILKNGTYVSKERLVLNIINYMEIVNETFSGSSFFNKNNHLLLVFYLYEQEKDTLDFLIKLVGDWQFIKNDLYIIKKDWEFITNKIKEGKAHELSEGDTFYLGACTKGSKGDNLREQPFSNIKAKQRAFSFKQGYVNHIIANLSNGESGKYSKLLTDNYIDSNKSIEDIVIEKFSKFYDLNIDKIMSILNVSLNKKAKSFYANLTKTILGIELESEIEEFQKADIIIKTIRLKQNSTPKEDVSFPTFKYKELILEEWDSSSLKEILEKKFCFVFYQYNAENDLVLKKVIFWNMPNNDLDLVEEMWMETINRINNKMSNSLPKKSEHPICHVRPHAKNKLDTYETPEGTQEVKKCFWLNASYIKSIYLQN